jgi:hypothetical protein
MQIDSREEHWWNALMSITVRVEGNSNATLARPVQCMKQPEPITDND